MTNPNSERLSEHFTCEELDSPDTGECLMDPVFLADLEGLRIRVSVPFFVTSGYRTPEHNAAIHGAEHGIHMLGKAVDISHESWDGITRMRFIREASSMGFSIGIYPKHFHVDRRVGPQVLWVSLRT